MFLMPSRPLLHIHTTHTHTHTNTPLPSAFYERKMHYSVIINNKYIIIIFKDNNIPQNEKSYDNLSKISILVSPSYMNNMKIIKRKPLSTFCNQFGKFLINMPFFKKEIQKSEAKF